MKKIISKIANALVFLLMLLLTAFVVIYFATAGDKQVMKTAAQNPDVPQLIINGSALHVETFGNDTLQPVIVLHGGPGNDFRYLLSLKELSDDYFMIFYDQLGCGLSERVAADKLNLNNSLADLDALVEHFGKGKKVNIIGHSWGGMLASAYLGRHPLKVNKIVLAEPGALNPGMYEKLMERTGGMDAEFSFPLLWHLIKCWVGSYHIDKIDGQERQDYFLQHLIFDYTGENHPIRGYFCNNILPDELPIWRWGSLAAASVPESGKNEHGDFAVNLDEGVEKYPDTVLFLVGGCETYIDEGFQKMNMALFYNAKMELIPEAGHYMFNDQPELCNEVVRGYFTETTYSVE